MFKQIPCCIASILLVVTVLGCGSHQSRRPVVITGHSRNYMAWEEVYPGVLGSNEQGR